LDFWAYREVFPSMCFRFTRKEEIIMYNVAFWSSATLKNNSKTSKHAGVATCRVNVRRKDEMDRHITFNDVRIPS
jgi:hypothetical protein